jgi:sodium/potassium-transporting ATPase subunit alpha
MNLFRAGPVEVLRSLGTRREGLSSEEAVRRRSEYGLNKVERIRRKPLHRRAIEGFTHVFALLLWFAAAVAFVADLSQPGQGMATLGYAIVGVIVLNALFAFWQEFRAERMLADDLRWSWLKPSFFDWVSFCGQARGTSNIIE